VAAGRAHSASSLLVVTALAACHRSPPAAAPTVEVRVEVPGATAAEVEASTTVPIERACAGMAHEAHLLGASEPGRSSVTVQLERGADVDAALAELRGKLQGIGPRLPKRAAPPVLTRSGGRLVGRYTTWSDVVALAQVHETRQAAWLQGLAATAGVESVVTCGDVVGRIAVNLDANALGAAGLTIPDLAAALSRTPAPPGDALALSGMVLATLHDVPLRLRDVASVIDDAAPPACRAYDDRGAVFEAAVYAQPSADLERVRADVARTLGPALRQLPPVLDVRPIGAGRTLTVDLDPAVTLTAAVDGLRAAVKTAAWPARFVVEIDAPDDGADEGADDKRPGARVVLDSSDEALVRRVAGALAAIPIVRSAGEPNATVELVGSDRPALVAAAHALCQRLAERGLLVARLGMEDGTASVPRVDRDAARKLGVSTADVELALEALHGKGIVAAGSDGRAAPVVLRLASPLDRVYVKAGSVLIPLSALVAMTVVTSPRLLLRQDGVPAMAARVQATDLAALQHVYEPPPGITLRVVPD
jgi:multidrug efflux pump subunit AcrB